MANSESHRFGEFIGDFFEKLMQKPIRNFAEKNGLYFDTQGPRNARTAKKVTWTDVNGSKHDLDFVIEKGGTEETIGDPVAFIELAWRRYTKHSKNKVQEIQGAVNPICEKHKLTKPFKGAILGGMFTENSLNQLKDDDFHVLYIPFEKLVEAFKNHNLDIYYDEKTVEADIQKKYAVVSNSGNKLDKVGEEILNTFGQKINQFICDLSASYYRKIKTICILPLHGKRTEVADVEKAIDFINDYSTLPADQKLEYIEIIITYNNNSFLHGQFKEKVEAVDFLEKIR